MALLLLCAALPVLSTNAYTLVAGGGAFVRSAAAERKTAGRDACTSATYSYAVTPVRYEHVMYSVVRQEADPCQSPSPTLVSSYSHYRRMAIQQTVGVVVSSGRCYVRYVLPGSNSSGSSTGSLSYSVVERLGVVLTCHIVRHMIARSSPAASYFILLTAVASDMIAYHQAGCTTTVVGK